MAPSDEQVVLTAANGTPGPERVVVALRGLAVLLARAHVREIAGCVSANRTDPPALASQGGGL